MPRVGDKEFAYTPEGEAEAQAYAEATGLPVQSQDEMMYAKGGKVDGSKRSKKEYLGGGMVKPIMPMYKDGGKVNKWKEAAKNPKIAKALKDKPKKKIEWKDLKIEHKMAKSDKIKRAYKKAKPDKIKRAYKKAK